MSPLTLSVLDTCGALSLSRSSVYKLIQLGRLHTIKIGSRTLVTMKSLNALVSGGGEA